MLRTTLIAATAAIGLTGAAIADGAKAPAILDDEALDGVVAGATVSPLQGSNSDIDQAVGVDEGGRSLNGALRTASLKSPTVATTRECGSVTVLLAYNDHGVEFFIP